MRHSCLDGGYITGEFSRKLSFARSHCTLSDVLKDHELASLGDSYINFAFSLTLSNRIGRPRGTKVKGKVLAEALRQAELRDYLPSRLSSHALADAAESLIVYAWLHSIITLEETVTVMQKHKDTVEGLTKLLEVIKNRITFL